jgi:hypothetical protein
MRNWFKPCKEFEAKFLEINKVMGLLEIRLLLSILTLIAWCLFSKYAGLI